MTTSPSVLVSQFTAMLFSMAVSDSNPWPPVYVEYTINWAAKGASDCGTDDDAATEEQP